MTSHAVARDIWDALGLFVAVREREEAAETGKDGCSVIQSVFSVELAVRTGELLHRDQGLWLAAAKELAACGARIDGAQNATALAEALTAAAMR